MADEGSKESYFIIIVSNFMFLLNCTHVQYYRQHAKHPFATTLAEETWQAGIIPSDTDFEFFGTSETCPVSLYGYMNQYIYILILK